MASAIKINGLTTVINELKATPAKVRRAQRNAVGVSITYASKKIINTVNRETGLAKKEIRNRLIITRPRQGEVTGSIRASDVPIPLVLYGPRIHKVSRTRASVTVKTDIGKPARKRSSVFVNPQFRSGKILMRRTGKKNHIPSRGRYAGKRREKTGTPHGPALSIHVDQLLNDGLLNDVGEFFVNAFQQKLKAQLSGPGRRRR
jgi:hypothetical protein